MALLEEHVDLVTAHGRLRIAIADIRRLELATRIPDSTLRQIEQAIDNLGSAEYRLREKAGAELVALREQAYPAVLHASQSKDAEVRKRAKEIVDKIREKVPAARLRIRTKDIVYTSDSTISGRIEVSSFNGTTKQFGDVKLLLSDASSICFLAGGAEIEVKLDGRHALNNEVWLDTGVDVSENIRLTITASGEIDMYATGGYIGQYVGTPKGKKAWPGNTGLPHEPGTLIGRVGQGGSVFVVRDQYEASAPASGRLYLRAAGNPYNVTTTGQYTIKIQGGTPAPGVATPGAAGP
jgi:hypothetical protein